MSRETRTIYLERSSYRRRRARDAARLLPLLALVLFFIPALWQISSESAGVSAKSALVFLFLAWIAVIVLSFFLVRYLKAPVVKESDPQSETAGHD